LQGWISLHRQITENWVWNDKPFSKGQAWIDLLLMANHEQCTLKTKTGFVVIEKGELHTEERTLEVRWGWSRSKVRLFLCSLVSQLMITKTVKKSTTGKTTEGTTIKVLNYCIYQDVQKQKEPPKKTKKNHRETTGEPPRDLNNNVNNVKQCNNRIYTFDEFYSAYPKKKKRPDAERAWLKVSPEEHERLMKALGLQKESADWKKNGGQYIPYPATWLNGRQWEDEITVTAAEDYSKLK
jgi:hypothetical protein